MPTLNDLIKTAGVVAINPSGPPGNDSHWGGGKTLAAATQAAHALVFHDPAYNDQQTARDARFFDELRYYPCSAAVLASDAGQPLVLVDNTAVGYAKCITKDEAAWIASEFALDELEHQLMATIDMGDYHYEHCLSAERGEGPLSWQAYLLLQEKKRGV